MPSEVDAAAIAAQLALEYPSWVQRRVERVTYLDSRMVRWECGVMFRWPEETFFKKDWQPKASEVVYVPLDLLTKGGLVGLDGIRPDDSRFPILSYEESTRLAYLGIAAVIWGKSKADRHGRLDDETVQLIRVIASAPRARAATLLDSTLKDPHSQLSRVLEDDKIKAYLGELARYLPLLVPAVYEPGKEVVYRYSYCKTIKGEHPLRALWNRLRFQDLELKHPRLSYGWGRSFHFEVEAPAEIRIPRARLMGTYDLGDAKHQTITQPVAEAGGRKVIDLHARRPTETAFEAGSVKKLPTRPPLLPAWPERAKPRRPEKTTAERRQETTAKYFEAAAQSAPTRVRRSDRGQATVWCRLDPSGTFLGATAVSLLTFLLLIAATARLSKLEGQTGAALLLALPIVTLGLLTRPGEHSFATRLLWAIRFAALVVGICALVTAWILAGGFIHHQDATRAPFACKANLNDTDVHRAPHHTWRTTADLDAASMSCAPGKGTPDSAQVGSDAKTTADVAMVVAGVMAGWLTLGWFYTLIRPSRLAPEAREPKIPGQPEPGVQ